MPLISYSLVSALQLYRFANADFASGIVPQEIKRDGGNSQFTWIFNDNVSVKILSVFTATKPIGKTGIIISLIIIRSTRIIFVV
uniref:hypothetical protein n=1 Tax=Cylindrospermopsis raciborskii TaxID=77022 RepID=UPI002E35B229|nr:hypothetical protein [Cylindrospermopsis raciborskii]